MPLWEFWGTPEFYSGLVTGALIAETVQKTLRGLLRAKFGRYNGNGKAEAINTKSGENP